MFLLIAFIFLLLTKFSKSYTTELQFNVEVNGLDKEILLITDGVPQLNITVQGRGFNLLPYMLYNPESIVLNAKTDLIQNDNVYVWTISENDKNIVNHLSKSLKLISVKPNQMRFQFDRRASKMVPVKIISDFEYAPGHDIFGKLNLDHDSVKVIGAEKDIAKISSIETVPLTLTNIDNDIDAAMSLVVPDSVDVLITPQTINIAAKVNAFTEGVVDVAVEVINIPDGVNINIFPKTVTIYYAVNLDDYNTINSEDFKVECDFNSIASEKQTFMIAEVKTQPDNVKRVRLKQQRIEFVKL
ncbi:MAG: hypothetical protein HKP45_07020 [Winogradskyella sp.]|nr:hypothetical protein [Winogradskyella sp.]